MERITRIKRNSTKDYLKSVPLPEQTGEDKYVIVPHERVMELTLKALEDNNFVIKGESYLGARGGQQAIGKYFIEYGDDKDMGLMIAWNNSYDKSTTLKWGIGSHVFVCDNGMISSDMNFFKRKHIGSIDEVTVEGIANYTKLAGNTFRELLESKERMKEVELTRSTVAELVGRLFIEEEIITATQLGIIHKEIKHPSFDYGAKNSMWELYNHVTYAIKEDHPHNWMSRHVDINNFFVNKSGLLLPINSPSLDDLEETIEFHQDLMEMDEAPVDLSHLKAGMIEDVLND